jgi:hypothetical protein
MATSNRASPPPPADPSVDWDSSNPYHAYRAHIKGRLRTSKTRLDNAIARFEADVTAYEAEMNTGGGTRPSMDSQGYLKAPEPNRNVTSDPIVKAMNEFHADTKELINNLGRERDERATAKQQVTHDANPLLLGPEAKRQRMNETVPDWASESSSHRNIKLEANISSQEILSNQAVPLLQPSSSKRIGIRFAKQVVCQTEQDQPNEVIWIDDEEQAPTRPRPRDLFAGVNLNTNRQLFDRPTVQASFSNRTSDLETNSPQSGVESPLSGSRNIDSPANTESMPRSRSIPRQRNLPPPSRAVIGSGRDSYHVPNQHQFTPMEAAPRITRQGLESSPLRSSPTQPHGMFGPHGVREPSLLGTPVVNHPQSSLLQRMRQTPLAPRTAIAEGTALHVPQQSIDATQMRASYAQPVIVGTHRVRELSLPGTSVIVNPQGNTSSTAVAERTPVSTVRGNMTSLEDLASWQKRHIPHITVRIQRDGKSSWREPSEMSPALSKKLEEEFYSVINSGEKVRLWGKYQALEQDCVLTYVIGRGANSSEFTAPFRACSLCRRRGRLCAKLVVTEDGVSALGFYPLPSKDRKTNDWEDLAFYLNRK